MGNFFGNLFRWVHPLLWSGAKRVGRQTLRTGGKILTDIAERSPTDVSEYAQNLISELRGRGRKRAREATGGKKNGPKSGGIHRIMRAPRKIIKRTFS